jgi:hypothetical protein
MRHLRRGRLRSSRRCSRRPKSESSYGLGTWARKGPPTWTREIPSKLQMHSSMGRAIICLPSLNSEGRTILLPTFAHPALHLLFSGPPGSYGIPGPFHYLSQHTRAASQHVGVHRPSTVCRLYFGVVSPMAVSDRGLWVISPGLPLGDPIDLRALGLDPRHPVFGGELL